MGLFGGSSPSPTYNYTHSEVQASFDEEDNLTFYNQLTGKHETRSRKELEEAGGVALERGHRGHGWQLRTGGGFTAESAYSYLKRYDQRLENEAKQEQYRKEAQAEADRRAAEAKAARAAAIRQQKIDNLNQRIEFEKTNVLKSTVNAATGKAFNVYSPGQKYVVPEGADILEGRFERLPSISLAEYRKQQGETGSGRLLGKGGRRKFGVTDDDDEALGTGTLLSDGTKKTSLIG